MNIKLLTEFTREDLGYKNNISITHFSIINNHIQLIFNDEFGEVVSIERYNSWISKRRELKLNNIC